METNKKVTAIDGKEYTIDELCRTNFLFIGGEFHGSTIKTINGIPIEKLSLTDVFSIGKSKEKDVELLKLSKH